MLNTLPFLLISSIWCLSFLVSVSPIIWGHGGSIVEMYLYFTLVPILFVFSFIIFAGILSQFGKKGIVSGTFPREPFHKIYLQRRIYGACWTQLFYFKPLYAIALSIPMLKVFMLRIFGYKHSTQFTVYPDTWIRDLPVLNIGKGAYLSNRATIGTNICLSDGNILVDSIEIDEKGLVGHLAVLAPGVKIGRQVEVGVSATIAIRTRLSDNCKINPCCMINHAVTVGENTRIGTMTYVGLKSVIGPNLDIPAGANIPAGSIIQTQEEMDKFFHSETEKLNEHVVKLKQMIQEDDKYELKV